MASWVTDMQTFLDGHKTDIVAVIAFGCGVLNVFGLIDNEQLAKLLGLLGPAGLYFMRGAIRKTEV